MTGFLTSTAIILTKAKTLFLLLCIFIFFGPSLARRKSASYCLLVGCDDFQVQVKVEEGDIPTEKIQPFKINTQDSK